MKTTNKNFVAESGKQLARYSAIIGIGIFLLFCITRFEALMPMGLFYLVVATAANGIMLLLLFIELLIKAKDRKQVLISIGIMLLNIPLSLTCATLALHL
ncbi:hypothetical protein VRU48_01900 [Pedobacter sp. KR3-3]|uniref:Uncharacterized protein n=1 Tax=Pedobacter albus TaxID=3113905 RepID=A0ABU7I3F5_9SPHI|nr:hypothetical protein [Pedobacter sp. KR3-3]MEE1943841.1 hypothetical protein [Pedobacter sp. KR3-3]